MNPTARKRTRLIFKTLLIAPLLVALVACIDQAKMGYLGLGILAVLLSGVILGIFNYEPKDM